MHLVNVNKLHSFSGHRDGVYTLQPAGTPNLFFSAAGDGMVVKWDLLNPDAGELIAKLPNSLYALHYHAASDSLIAGQNYQGIHVLDWRNKKEIGSLKLTDSGIFDLQSFENFVFVASGDGTLFRVDLDKLLIVNRAQNSVKSARTMAIHRTRGELAVGYSDHYIRVFDLLTFQQKYAWRAHQNSVFSVRYSQDGNYLLSGSRDARLKAWDVTAGYVQANEVVAHMFAINHIEFSPDGKHFVTCSMDKSIKVWALGEMKLMKVIDKARHGGHATSVNKLLWTTHRSQLLSASDDRTISAWSINFE